MRSFLTKHKDGSATVTVKVDDITDIMANMTTWGNINKIIAKRFAEEYYTDIIKKVDSKTLTNLIMIEVARKAVRD